MLTLQGYFDGNMVLLSEYATQELEKNEQADWESAVKDKYETA